MMIFVATLMIWYVCWWWQWCDNSTQTISFPSWELVTICLLSLHQSRQSTWDNIMVMMMILLVKISCHCSMDIIIINSTNTATKHDHHQQHHHHNQHHHQHQHLCIVPFQTLPYLDVELLDRHHVLLLRDLLQGSVLMGNPWFSVISFHFSMKPKIPGLVLKLSDIFAWQWYLYSLPIHSYFCLQGFNFISQLIDRLRPKR